MLLPQHGLSPNSPTNAAWRRKPGVLGMQPGQPRQQQLLRHILPHQVEQCLEGCAVQVRHNATDHACMFVEQTATCSARHADGHREIFKYLLVSLDARRAACSHRRPVLCKCRYPLSETVLFGAIAPAIGRCYCAGSLQRCWVLTAAARLPQTGRWCSAGLPMPARAPRHRHRFRPLCCFETCAKQRRKR